MFRLCPYDAQSFRDHRLTLAVVRRPVLQVLLVLLAFVLASCCGSVSASLSIHTSRPVPSPSSAPCAAPHASEPCYSALQLEEAYNLKPLYSRGLNGSGTTVVVLAENASPTLSNDLTVFDNAFHLPAPSIRVVSVAGSQAAFDPESSDDVGGAAEVTLDTEAVHTIAPEAKIVVLVAPPVTEDSGVDSEIQAVYYAAQHHLGQVVTTSLGNVGEAALGAKTINRLHQDLQYAAARHITVVDASGDFGATSRRTLEGPAGPGCCFTERMRGYPASDPLVVAVGATRLSLNASGNRISPDTVAGDPSIGGASGGGLSTVFSRPSYQDTVESVVGDHRGGPDVSMSGDLYGGFEMYSSFPNQSNGLPEGWTSVGGTSESAPLFAGIAAIIDQALGRPLGPLNSYLYATYQLPGHGGLVPVTSGSNTVTIESSNGTPVTVPGYEAAAGYNLATGLGTVDASELVSSLAHLAQR
jgi:subtilase family serine protease